ncbi:MAG: BON domain-containing protein [Vicinamibacterales bacterium]
MLEPLFAPTSSIWTPIPSPGFGWYQMPPGIANRPSGPSPSPFGGVPIGMPELSAQSLVAAVAQRRGQPQGPVTDQDVEEFLYDTFELLAGAGDVDLRCESGRVTLTGTVAHKRLKHDLGEIVWAIPAVTDVQNTVAIAARRRGRPAPGPREGEGPSNAPARKQA